MRKTNNYPIDLSKAVRLNTGKHQAFSIATELTAHIHHLHIPRWGSAVVLGVHLIIAFDLDEFAQTQRRPRNAANNTVGHHSVGNLGRV